MSSEDATVSRTRRLPGPARRTDSTWQVMAGFGRRWQSIGREWQAVAGRPSRFHFHFCIFHFESCSVLPTFVSDLAETQGPQVLKARIAQTAKPGHGCRGLLDRILQLSANQWPLPCSKMGIGCHGFGVLDKAVPIAHSHGLIADGETVTPHFEQGNGPERRSMAGRLPLPCSLIHGLWFISAHPPRLAASFRMRRFISLKYPESVHPPRHYYYISCKNVQNIPGAISWPGAAGQTAVGHLPETAPKMRRKCPRNPPEPPPNHPQTMHEPCTICARLSAEVHVQRDEFGGACGHIGDGQSALSTPAIGLPSSFRRWMWEWVLCKLAMGSN